MRIFSIITLLALSLNINAQQDFTERLTRHHAGEGKVVLHQDSVITGLVNGHATATTASTRPVSTVVAGTDTTTTEDLTPLPTRRSRATGYRIQVYAGGNNRNSKSEAYRMANLVRSEFPDLAVYTHFISPRWICRVGDFKTNEEAREMLKQMRQTKKFREASIVKSNIIVYQ